MKTWKKVTAVVLAVCLLVSGMTMSASAAEATKVSGDFLAGANLNLNEGIAIQFFVKAEDVEGYDNSYLSVEYLDRDATVRTKDIEPVAYGDYMNYKFDAIAPDRMADDITATLYGTKNGTKYQLGETITYSVKTYVENTYLRTNQVVNGDDSLLDNLSLQTLLADILYYGETARLYTGVDAASPLTDWVASTKTATPATPYASDASSSVKKLTYSDGVTSSTEHISWSSVGLNLRENPAILYKFKLTNKASGVSNYKLVVEDAAGTVIGSYPLSAEWYDKTERCYTYRFRGLNPTKMGEQVSAYFVNAQGAKVSAVLDYSVESFANFCYNETVGGTVASDTVTKELYNLTQATLSYGTSAKSYFGKRVLPFSKGINVNKMETFLSDNQYGFFEMGIETLTAESTYTNIKSQGFDHVRIPVNFYTAYYEATSYGYTTEQIMGYVDTAIDLATKNGLYVILDFHGWFYIGEESDDEEQFLNCWTQVANRYKDYSDMLVFELLNEPWKKNGSFLWSPSKLNQVQASAISIIRNTGSNNADRLIICCTADGNKAYMLDELTLPDDDNLAVAIHEYEPYAFTHQNFKWAGTSGSKPTLTEAGGFSGVNYDFSKIKSFTEKTGIPVILSEFGMNLDAPSDEDINTYLSTLTKLCRQNRMAWTYWQYDGLDFSRYEWSSRQNEMALYRELNNYNQKEWDEAALNALFPARAAAAQ